MSELFKIENVEEEEDYGNLQNDISPLRNTSSMPNFRSSRCDLSSRCDHFHVEKKGNIEICVDCGIEIEQEISTEPDERYYGENDSKHSSDPNRCHLRKYEEKTIYKDIEEMNFSLDIVECSNDLYFKITSGSTKRGNIRKALVFACVFNAFKQKGDPQLPDELRKKFNITKQQVSKGLNFFNRQYGKTKRMSQTSPSAFISKIMSRFNASRKQVSDVEKLFDKIQNKSLLLNRSNPLSVISGLIYYYCKSIGRSISCSHFSEIVELSELTIIKIAKEICEVLGTKNEIRL
jgi:hypothetical protein